MGRLAALQKFALAPPTQVDQFVADVDAGKDVPPGSMMGGMDGSMGGPPPPALDGSIPMQPSQQFDSGTPLAPEVPPTDGMFGG
jgi:hypothetical protein